MASDMKLQFNIGATFSELKAAATQAKAELLSLVNTVKQAGQDVKIKVGLDIGGLNTDIQNLKTTVRNALQGAATNKIKVKIEADVNSIRADIAAIRPQIQSALSNFAPISLTINHAKLAQQLQAAEAQVRAAIARMTTPTALRISLNVDALSTGLIAALNALKVEVNSLKQVMSRGGGRGGLGGGSGGGLGGASSDVNGFASAMRDARNQLMQLVSVFGLMIGLKGFAKITDEAKSLESKLKLVTSSQQELNQVTAGLREIAKNNLQGLAPTVELYSKLYSGTKNLEGANTALNMRLTDVVSKLVTISGSTGPAAEGAIIQFGQALSGNFSAAGQELNSIIEQAPALADAIAKSYGVTRGELKKLGAEGKITAEGVVNGLIRQGVEVDALFGKVNKTIGGTATTTGDSIKHLISEVDKSVGASKAIIGFLENMRNKATEMWAQMEADGSQSIKNFFETAQDVISLLIGYGLTRLAASLAVSTKGFYSQAVAAQVAANQTLVNARADVLATSMALRRAEAEKANALALLASARASGVSAAATSAAMAQAVTATAAATSAAAAHAAAQRALAAATTQANIAMRASTGLLTALGGPIGAIITLLGVAATAWVVFGDKAEKAIDKAKTAIDKINKNESVDDSELQALSDKLITVQSQIDSTLDNIRSASLSSNENVKLSLQKELDNLRSEKKAIEDAIKTVQFNRTLDNLLPDLDSQKLGTVKTKAKTSSTDPFAIKKADLDAEIQLLDARFNAEEIGMRKYYAEKARLIAAIHNNELANIDAKIKAENDPTKKGDLLTKRKEAETAKATALSLNKIDLNKAIADAKKESLKISVELDDANFEAINNKFDAKEREIAEKYKKQLEDFKKATLDGFGDTAEAASLIAEKTDLVNGLINAEKAQNNLKRIEEEIKAFTESQNNKVKNIDLLKDRGQLSNPDARDQTEAVNQGTVVGLTMYQEKIRALNAEDIPETKRLLDELAQKMAEVPVQATTNMDVFFANTNEKLKTTGVEALKSGLSDFFMDIATGAKSGSDAIKDFARGFAQSMARVAADALATIAVLQILNAVSGGKFQLVNGAIGLKSQHTGGIAGIDGQPRTVDMSLFNAAPRYHVGGIAGLQPGEVPAILQRGEEVLTQKDPRHVANGGGQGGGVRIINNIDPNMMHDYLSSSSGEQVIVNLIERNSGTIKQLLG